MNKIKYHRERAQLTREQLASLTGLSASTIYNYEKRLPNKYTASLKNISEVFGVSYLELLEEEKEVMGEGFKTTND